jgi:hypothetical protein
MKNDKKNQVKEFILPTIGELNEMRTNMHKNYKLMVNSKLME